MERKSFYTEKESRKKGQPREWKIKLSKLKIRQRITIENMKRSKELIFRN